MPEFIETIIVTRHKPIVQWIKAKGLAPDDAKVLDFATEAEVKGKHVVGILPISVASKCDQYTEVRPKRLPQGTYLDNLSYEQLCFYITEPKTYIVYEEGDEQCRG